MNDYVLEDCKREYQEELDYERRTYGRELKDWERLYLSKQEES